MNWNTAVETLATSLPNFEVRPQQQRLALAIEQNLTDEKILFAQAGTGTGKSFANLIPAISRALEIGQPVMVATATKALQDQYVRDLEFLQQHLDVEFSFTILKGRSNYACMAKVNGLASNTVTNQDAIISELATSEFGEIDGLTTEVAPMDRSKLVSSSDECPGKKECPFGAVCFAEFAKERAQTSTIVVTNHALLVMDRVVAAKGASLLPEFNTVMIDEAHEFEDYATSALGSQISQGTITSLASQIGNFVGDLEIVRPLNGSAVRLFTVLTSMLGRESNKPLDDRAILVLEEPVSEVMAALQGVLREVSYEDVEGNDKRRARQKQLVRRIESLNARLVDLLVAEESAMIRWIEAQDRGTVIMTAPLHVGPFLAQHLWEDRSAVLLSATLALGKDFSYIANRLGIVDYDSYDAGTPFDYPNQAALFVPNGFDPTQGATWRSKCAATIGELVKAADGRALLLFTSRTAMNEAWSSTHAMIERSGYTVLRQGDKPNKALVAEFKSDKTSVLFALKSFMTGVDIQGDALRLVVIDKMPFPVPTDVIVAARAKAIDDASDGSWNQKAFMKMTVPMMALTLMQAFGRLIRTKQDRGVVVILDSRLHTKGYGKSIMRMLPPARRVTDLGETVKYLEALS